MLSSTEALSAGPLPASVCAEMAFLATFAYIITKTPAQATAYRFLGFVLLATITYSMETLISQVCLLNGRPHWAAISGSFIWIQLLSGSELLLVSRVKRSDLPRSRSGSLSAIGLLWNVRRIDTKWQVKNVPLGKGGKSSRTTFLLRRIALALCAYILIDIAVSLPPPNPSLVMADKALLFSLPSLDDFIFRSITTITYWVSSAIINFLMNSFGVIFAVFFHLSNPEDCPPLYGSFMDAFTIRRFWGISWHQMFRVFLTGHAELLVEKLLPSLSRKSLASRYLRLAIAFFISGAIHFRSDQLIGVPDAENRSLTFFMIHAISIMVEDGIASISLSTLPIKPLRRVLGFVWTISFFIWTTPIWIYPSSRLGLDSTALVPFSIAAYFKAVNEEN
jgi:hypothetical protein